MHPMDKGEGVHWADAVEPIECVDCDAAADLVERDASKPADIGWLHEHDEDGIENYCPECRPDQQDSAEANS